jgi:hypothetical protein
LSILLLRQEDSSGLTKCLWATGEVWVAAISWMEVHTNQAAREAAAKAKAKAKAKARIRGKAQVTLLLCHA